MNPTLSNSHVIIVDDESINLAIMEISLVEQGCKVTTFQSATHCLETLESQNLKNYDCIITDYSMPGMSGIDLLQQIKKMDSTLEVILVTGENERKIIQESLRQGAFDFLDKPLNLEKFYSSVGRAIEATSQRRKRDATEASLLAARSTGLFNNIETYDWKTSIELKYAPKHELGGDFIEVFETQAGQRFSIFGDISGHDIQSALLSSHFLGHLQGRRTTEKELQIRILLENYNELLIERSQNLGNNQNLRVGSSLCVGAVEMINDEREMRITNCGLPAIYLIDRDSNVKRIPPNHHPLGWFTGLSAEYHEEETIDQHKLLGFTDGFVEFAMNHKWDVLSLVYHLDKLNKSDIQSLFINAGDDILMTSMLFNTSKVDLVPILFDEYAGHTASKIDQYQQVWKNSLKLALPISDPNKIDRFVLACREAVINSLKHGCKGDRSKKATFLVKIDERSNTLECMVEDPGDGHDFSYQERNSQLEAIIPGHLGLVLISKLVDEMIIENKGARLRMKMKV